jgi:alkaline phosphatase D
LKSFPAATHEASPGGCRNKTVAQVDIYGQTEQLTVRLVDRNDKELWRIVLDPDVSS